MKYRKGYKYQLAEDLHIKTEVRPVQNARAKWVELDENGDLRIRAGFAWDGASGPVIDRRTNTLAACVHDSLYYLMRRGILSRGHWAAADREYAKLLREAGAWRITVAVDRLGLKLARGRYAGVSLKKRVYST